MAKEYHGLKCPDCEATVRVVVSVKKATCRWHTVTCVGCGSNAITDEQMRVFTHRTCQACGFVNVMPQMPV